MAKLNSFEALCIVDGGIKAANNNDWALMEAHSIQVNDDVVRNRLDDALNDIKTDIDELEYRIDNMGTSGDGSSTVVEKATPISYFTFTTADDDSDAYSVSCDNKEVEHIVIPRTYNGKPVTQIGSFMECINLKHIYIPNSIKKIHNNAFHGCRELLDIHIPDSVTLIGTQAFYRCPKLQVITIPRSLTNIYTPIVEKYHYLDGDGPYPATVYCESESKPSGWANSWNGYRDDTKVPVIWGANIAALRPSAMVVEHSYSANRAVEAECDIDGKPINTTYTKASDFNKLLTGETKAKRAEWIGGDVILGTVYSSNNKIADFGFLEEAIYLLQIQLLQRDSTDPEDPVNNARVFTTVVAVNHTFPSHIYFPYKGSSTHVYIEIRTVNDSITTLEITEGDVTIGYCDMRRITG
jgi:hypothetical protein